MSPSTVDTWLNVSRVGGPSLSFFRRFSLRFPPRPVIGVHGSLIVDINKPSIISYSVQNYRDLASVIVGGIGCPFIINRNPSFVVVSISIDKNTFLLSDRSDVLFKTLVDPDFFSVDAPPALFRDFSLLTVDLVVPSSGPDLLSEGR
jgi:hypothetical protein